MALTVASGPKSAGGNTSASSRVPAVGSAVDCRKGKYGNVSSVPTRSSASNEVTDVSVPALVRQSILPDTAVTERSSTPGRLPWMPTLVLLGSPTRVAIDAGTPGSTSAEPLVRPPKVAAMPGRPPTGAPSTKFGALDTNCDCSASVFA